jgi:hypothetical protein
MPDEDSDFSLAGLYAAMDAVRNARGLSWRDIVREINEPFAHVTSRPIALSTVTSTRTKAVAEGDGVLQMLRWLHRTPESFVVDRDGLDGLSPERFALPELLPNEILRFDTRQLFAAINARRLESARTWDQVASDIGVSASSLIHLSKGGRTGFPHVVRMTRWLGLPVADFTRVCSR